MSKQCWGGLQFPTVLIFHCYTKALTNGLIAPALDFTFALEIILSLEIVRHLKMSEM